MINFLLSGSQTTTCLVGLVVGLLAFWSMKRWKYNYPPGPPGLPLLGNILQMDFSTIHEKVFEWSKKYGPVITVYVGPVPNVFVNTVDSALECLVKKSTDFAGRNLTPSFEVFSRGGKDIFFSSYGPTWKLQRRIASKALRHYLQGDGFQTRVHGAIETTLVELDKVSDEFDPGYFLKSIVSNIRAELCFGGKYGFNDKDAIYVLEKMEVFLEEFGAGPLEDIVPGLRYVCKTEAFKCMEKFTDDLFDHYFYKKFVAAKATFDKENIRHFTDYLINARREAKHEVDEEIVKSLTDIHLAQTVSNIFLSGIDSSLHTIKTAILHMVAFPDIQDRVQQEIDRVVGHERLPELSDRPSLCYTDAVLHESMRLVTFSPLGLPHSTLCDTEINGYKIPKGTTVVINHWAFHHDPSAWKDPDRFVPERFLEENGQFRRKPKNWFPFSAGKRVCLGQFVAKQELFLIFSCLMHRYRWKMVLGKCPDINPIRRKNGIFCKPYKVIIEKRF